MDGVWKTQRLEDCTRSAGASGSPPSGMFAKQISDTFFWRLRDKVDNGIKKDITNYFWGLKCDNSKKQKYR